MESYVILTNFHRSETCLLLEDKWNDAVSNGRFELTHDTDDDLMYVVRYFDASSWDDACVIYDAWGK